MNVQLQCVLASVVASAVTGATVAAGFVNLQDTTPGTPQTGHINVTGTVRAGNLGLGAAPGANRAQVTAAGTTGGLRVDTNTGVGVLAVTKGVAGQFITTGATAPNHRAVVADAQASTGVTFGGVFATRTTGAGAGAFARAIGANNTATGLIAENTASTGKALVARNTGNNNTLEAGTANDSLRTDGALPRHGYDGGDAVMVPIAYGFVNSDGTRASGTPNWTSVYNVPLAQYEVTITGVSYFFNEFTTVVTRHRSVGFAITDSNGGKLVVRTRDIVNVPDQAFFAFVVYRHAPIPQGATPLAPPKHGFATDSEWAERRPEEYRRYAAAWRAPSARPSSGRVLPTDEDTIRP